MGGRIVKKYRVYEKALPGGGVESRDRG
jgi:hypothetical protein